MNEGKRKKSHTPELLLRKACQHSVSRLRGPLPKLLTDSQRPQPQKPQDTHWASHCCKNPHQTSDLHWDKWQWSRSWQVEKMQGVMARRGLLTVMLGPLSGAAEDSGIVQPVGNAGSQCTEVGSLALIRTLEPLA